METFNSKYGDITLFRNEVYIADFFRRGIYWDEDTLIKLREYVDPTRNILEIGGITDFSEIN